MANKIGEAFVELVARMDKLEASLTEARASMDQYAAKAKASNDSAAASFESASERISASMEKVNKARQTYGRLAGAAGALASGLSTLQQVIEYVDFAFADATEKAQAFTNSLIAGTDVKALEKNLQGIQQKIIDVQTELAANLERPLSLMGRSSSTIKSELAQLQRDNDALAGQIQTARIRQKEAEEKAQEQRDRERFDDLMQWQQDMQFKADAAAADQKRKLEEDERRKWVEAEKQAITETNEYMAEQRLKAAEQFRGEVRSARQELEAWRRQLNERGGATDIRRLARAIHVASLRNMGR